MEMPTILKQFLTHMPANFKDEVWEYLDGNPDCVHEMIELVATKNGEPNVNTGQTGREDDRRRT